MKTIASRSLAIFVHSEASGPVSIDRRDVKKTLPVAHFNGEPIFLATFLVGAYQEILGDLHNLFGDTNAVQCTDEKGAV